MSESNLELLKQTRVAYAELIKVIDDPLASPKLKAGAIERLIQAKLNYYFAVIAARPKKIR